MKEESRKILDELMREHSCRLARLEGLSNEEYESIDKYNESIDKYNHHEDKICEFLESIPQIESHLCKGGYIQDKNGTPCCDGDRVRFEFEDNGYEINWKNRYERIIEGELQFSTETKSFAILFGEGKNGWNRIDWNTTDWGCKWFEKIKE